jgi:DNA-binding MarR family transcriptional regulator
VADRDRRRRETAVLSGLRDLRIELAVLNHRVGTKAELKDLDFDCLDVIARHGPLTPSALAARVGVHVATMTGILNRLEEHGWVTRSRSDDDRRAVVVASTADRQREIYRMFGGMNARMAEILSGYSDADLATIADFIDRTVSAGRAAADEVR